MGPILVSIDTTFSRNQYQGDYPYGESETDLDIHASSFTLSEQYTTLINYPPMQQSKTFNYMCRRERLMTS